MPTHTIGDGGEIFKEKAKITREMGLDVDLPTHKICDGGALLVRGEIGVGARGWSGTKVRAFNRHLRWPG